MIEEASSWYNALQVRFQKRTTHHVSFEGSYTISKSTDDSFAGRNNWVGALGAGIPQQLDRLFAERSIGGNDTPQRLAAAVVVDLPIGRKQWIGGNMNRAVDAVVGRLVAGDDHHRAIGQPMAIGMSNARLANGTYAPRLCAPNLDRDQHALRRLAVAVRVPPPISTPTALPIPATRFLGMLHDTFPGCAPTVSTTWI